MVNPITGSGKERVLILIAGICVIAGGALFLVCQWGPGIGTDGVICKLFGSIGVGVLGAGTLAIGVLFAKSLVKEFISSSPAAKRDDLRQLAFQFCTVLLNLLVYGALFLLVMGGIAALDGASMGTIVVVVVIWALCIVAFIAYRRFRKKHKAQYGLIGTIGMTAFLLALGLGLLVLGCANVVSTARDLQDGPVEADVFLVDASVDYPSWRYRAVVQKQHALTFYTADDERIVVVVPESDIAQAKVINDYGNFVHLTYYPNSQVFCGASPWPDGREAMGEELLAKLNREYDFEL